MGLKGFFMFYRIYLILLATSLISHSYPSIASEPVDKNTREMMLMQSMQMFFSSLSPGELLATLPPREAAFLEKKYGTRLDTKPSIRYESEALIFGKGAAKVVVRPLDLASNTYTINGEKYQFQSKKKIRQVMEELERILIKPRHSAPGLLVPTAHTSYPAMFFLTAAAFSTYQFGELVSDFSCDFNEGVLVHKRPTEYNNCQNQKWKGVKEWPAQLQVRLMGIFLAKKTNDLRIDLGEETKGTTEHLSLECPLPNESNFSIFQQNGGKVEKIKYFFDKRGNFIDFKIYEKDPFGKYQPQKTYLIKNIRKEHRLIVEYAKQIEVNCKKIKFLPKSSKRIAIFSKNRKKGGEKKFKGDRSPSLAPGSSPGI